jgi:biopolymer transport protein ExbD
MGANPKGFGLRGRLEVDSELNIVSIIDCLTVLIIYLLAAASFVAIGALELGLGRFDRAPASAGGTTGSVTPQKKDLLSLELRPSRDAVIQAVHFSPKGSESVPIAARADGSWNIEEIQRQIGILKGKYPTIESVILIAQDKILYADLVAVAHRLRETMPITLGVGGGG